MFGSERPTGALLDRLSHHVYILEMNGDSYRLRHSRQNAASQVADVPETRSILLNPLRWRAALLPRESPTTLPVGHFFSAAVVHLVAAVYTLLDNRRLTGLARPDYDAIGSFGLPFEGATL